MSDRVRIVDDGTLDTVLVCKGCGAEARYTFDGRQVWDGSAREPTDDYLGFTRWAIADFDSEHDCAETEADHD